MGNVHSQDCASCRCRMNADVQAAVERVRGYLDETEPARHDVIETMRDGTVDVCLSRSDLRALLAHLSPEAP